MELLQLRYFQTVARLEHITRAAEELQIAQPSLSKTIARLEESVGAPLFDRQGRNIRLNPFGKAFLSRVDNAFRELEEGKREVLDMAGLNQGSIRLAASIISVLPEILGEFLTLYPNVHFQQVFEPAAVMKRMLEAGEIDLCMMTVPIEGPDLEWMPLRKEEIYVVVPENHRLAGRQSVSLAELKDEAFVGMRQGYWFRTMTDEMCERIAGFRPNLIIEVEEADAVVVLLRKGLGISFIPELAWKKRTAFLPHLLKIEDNHGYAVTTGITWSKKHYLSVAAQKFRQFVIDFYPNIDKNVQA